MLPSIQILTIFTGAKAAVEAIAHFFKHIFSDILCRIITDRCTEFLKFTSFPILFVNFRVLNKEILQLWQYFKI